MLKMLELTPTTWSEFPDVEDVQPLNETDEAVLAEIQQVLIKHDKTNRFGVSLIHRHFTLNEGEVLLEVSDVAGRSQLLEVRPQSELADRANILQTQWVFNGTAAKVCAKACHYNKGHKQIHI